MLSLRFRTHDPIPPKSQCQLRNMERDFEKWSGTCCWLGYWVGYPLMLHDWWLAAQGSAFEKWWNLQDVMPKRRPLSLWNYVFGRDWGAQPAPLGFQVGALMACSDRYPHHWSATLIRGQSDNAPMLPHPGLKSPKWTLIISSLQSYLFGIFHLAIRSWTPWRHSSHLFLECIKV